MSTEFLQQQSDRLLAMVADAGLKFALYDAEDWELKSAPDKWSRKEILGHLIDSAANNHIRFVRAQLAEREFVSHRYEQNFFVSSQQYQKRNANDIVALWNSYNLHLIHVIRNMDPQKLSVMCKIGDYEPQTLAFIIEDYVTHLQHHLKQIYEA